MPTLEEVFARVEPYTGSGPHYDFMGGSVVADQNCRVLVTVLNEHGFPQAGIKVTNMRVDAQWECIETNGAGQAEFFMGKGSKFSPPDQGPHTVYVGDGPKRLGAAVVGLGLLYGHHMDYSVGFKYTLNGGTPPPPDSTENKGCIVGLLEFILGMLKR
jgi:hypothetical protein